MSTIYTQKKKKKCQPYKPYMEVIKQTNNSKAYLQLILNQSNQISCLHRIFN